MRSKHKVLIVLISVLVVGIAVCAVIKTDAVHLMIPRGSIDVNDTSAVWEAINKEVYKYYHTEKYYDDTPEVRQERLKAIFEELEDEGLIEEGSISNIEPTGVGITTIDGVRIIYPCSDPDPNHN